jgi:hypothetical protein
MMSWRPRRRVRMASIDAEAEALIRDLGERAYSEARRRESEASSDAIAKDWGRVAQAVARRMEKRTGIETAAGMAANSALAPDRGPAPARKPHADSKIGAVDEPKPALAAKRQRFRLQFLGAAADRGPAILDEVEIQAADVSEAIVAAANTTWPPHTIGLRILDREGREVFERQKADRR